MTQEKIVFPRSMIRKLADKVLREAGERNDPQRIFDDVADETAEKFARAVLTAHNGRQAQTDIDEAKAVFVDEAYDGISLEMDEDQLDPPEYINAYADAVITNVARMATERKTAAAKVSGTRRSAQKRR